MCGIAGIVVAPGMAPPAPELGRRMAGVIHHRGPDDGGMHCDPRALLCMRRLAIVDIAGGQQPARAAAGRVVLVFNGEIYNHDELRGELERDGSRFATRSEAEVILQAYLRWGSDVVARLDGMFAIAIWDRRSNELLLARDRFGEKPLYYTANDRRILFGSELKSLLQSDDCPRDLAPDALRAYLGYGYVPAPGSIFAGVSKLPPGHWLRYRDGHVQLHRYWRPDLSAKTRMDETEAGDELARLLDRAVASRLGADVPFGAFLSGGLDSSTVVALMARHLDRPVKTFTIGFAEDSHNELGDARVVADFLGTEHHELTVRPDAVALLQQLVWHFDEPFADASAIPTFLVSQLARRHVKMVLTGDGGDELFGGYDRYLRLLALERLGPFARPAAAALRVAGALLPDPVGDRLDRIGERLQLPAAERYLSSVALQRAGTARALHPQAGGARHYHLPMLAEAGADLGAGRSPLDRAVAIDLQSYLPDDILVKLDRMAMANSLEGRSPFLEPRLARFALSLPEPLRVRGGQGKYLLRKVAQRWLPPRAVAKPKQGFGIPLGAWLRGPLRELARDTFASRAFRERGLCDARVAGALLDEHLSGRVDRRQVLWQVICLELWAQRFLDPSATGD